MRSFQTVFYLTEVDFIKLKGLPSRFSAAGAAVIAAWIGWAIPLLPKLVVVAVERKNPFDRNEIITTVMAAILAAILFGVGQMRPTERSKTMKKIEQHFAENSNQFGTLE